MNANLAALTAFLAFVTVAMTPAASDAATNDHPLVQDVVFDITRQIDPTLLAFNVFGCEVDGTPASAYSEEFVPLPQQDGFRFRERDPVAPTAPGDPPGYNSAGCGVVYFNATIPVGTEHIHVRFDADREAKAREGSLHDNFKRFRQGLTLSVGPGATVRTEYFNQSAESSPSIFIDPAQSINPGPATSIYVAWDFMDLGTNLDNSVLKVPGGGAYGATITNATIEFSGVVIPTSQIRESDRRGGTFLFHDVAVTVPVGEELLQGQDADLRIRLEPTVSFTKVIAPDGTEITERTTRTASGPRGFDRSLILLERTDQFTQITVPSDLLRAYGPGNYVLVETQQSDVLAVPALIPVAVVLLLVPFPFAAMAFFKIRVFEREAFGGFQRSARKLRYALVAAALYYLIVIGAALFGDRLAIMANFPLTSEAMFQYLQVFLAGAVFVALWLVARELYNITVPKVTPEDGT